METAAELVPVIFGLIIVLSLVLPFVFITQKLRGVPTKAALRFTGVGFGICIGVSVTFVLAVTALGALADPDNSLPAERDCLRLGGEMHSVVGADGHPGFICVVE